MRRGARRGLLLGALVSMAMLQGWPDAKEGRMATSGADLVERARRSGSVSVIVGFAPAGTPPGGEAAIAAAREALYRALGVARGADGVLDGPGIERVVSYATIPFVAMTVDATALQRILGQPMVTSVGEDLTAVPQPRAD